MRIVLMGVSGSGKSAVGRALASRLGWPMLEGDDFHPPANVAKMRAGKPLDDADRRPWLDALAVAMAGHERAVVACSALTRASRDRLRAAADDVRFVFLRVGHDDLARQLAHRAGHFFNPELLGSQLDALEPPTVEEALIVSADAPPDVLARRIAEALPGS